MYCFSWKMLGSFFINFTFLILTDPLFELSFDYQVIWDHFEPWQEVRRRLKCIFEREPPDWSRSSNVGSIFPCQWVQLRPQTQFSEVFKIGDLISAAACNRSGQEFVGISGKATISHPLKLNSNPSNTFKGNPKIYSDLIFSYQASGLHWLNELHWILPLIRINSPGKEKMQSASWTIRPMTRNRMVTSLKKFPIYPFLPHNCPFLTIDNLFDHKLCFWPKIILFLPQNSTFF